MIGVSNNAPRLPVFVIVKVPPPNSSGEGDQITYHGAEHLGIAVDTERGLLVPVIHNAGDLNMGGIARKISDLNCVFVDKLFSKLERSL